MLQGKHAHIPDNDYWGICLFQVVWTNLFSQLFLCGTHGIYFYFFFINWTLRMSVNLPDYVHIICITVLENRIICCQIFCDLLLKSAIEGIFNVMQLILVKIKWHIKWKYLIQKFHDICLSYYFKCLLDPDNNFLPSFVVVYNIKGWLYLSNKRYVFNYKIRMKYR